MEQKRATIIIIIVVVVRIIITIIREAILEEDGYNRYIVRSSIWELVVVDVNSSSIWEQVGDELQYHSFCDVIHPSIMRLLCFYVHDTGWN